MSTSRVVVVTGASAGVGRAVARRFGARGNRVALIARGEDGLAGAADDIRDSGGEARSLPVDAAEAKVEGEFGPIDVWVNTAFASVFAPFCSIGRRRRISSADLFVFGSTSSRLSRNVACRPLICPTSSCRNRASAADRVPLTSCISRASPGSSIWRCRSQPIAP